MKIKLFPYIQYLLPKRIISKLCGFLANTTISWIKNRLIRSFVKYYRVDLTQAKIENPTAYQSFNEFFTRPLKDNMRNLPADPTAIVSPADGQISQLGSIEKNQIIQAKGKYYTLSKLLGENSNLSNKFPNGSFITIYLSPRDYHRVHMPVSGTLTQTTHIPGLLFSVNNATTLQIPNLFAQNERVVSYFETPDNHAVAVIMVGAMIVSSIVTKWGGLMISENGKITTKKYPTNSQNIKLERGSEMGLFQLGSTAIILFEQRVKWNSIWKANSNILMGKPLGFFC